MTGGNPFYVTELLASRVRRRLPPSVTNAVLGRASRLDEDARRLVELVSVVPSRVEHVGARRGDARLARGGGGARAPGAARGRAAVRALPARAGAERDQLERPDRRAPAAFTRRSSTRCSRRDADPADIVHHAEAAGAEDVVAEYALVAARRAAALESNGEAYSHYRRAVDFVDRLPAPEQAAVHEELATVAYAVGRLDDAFAAMRARDRGSTRRSATRRRSAAARGSSRGSTGTRATAPRRAAKAREAVAILEPLGESVELAHAYSGLSQLAMLAEDTGRGARAGGSARSRSRPARRRAARASTRWSTSRSARLQLDHREAGVLLEAIALADGLGEQPRGDAGALATSRTR